MVGVSSLLGHVYQNFTWREHVFIFFGAVVLVHLLRRNTSSVYQKRIAVVVLGDIGHSPRMQYHALSLANLQCARANGTASYPNVTMIGYGDSQPIEAIRKHKQIDFWLLRAFKSPMPIPYPVYALCKITMDVVQLCYALLVRKYDVVFMQNPPSIPVMAIARLISWASGGKFVIDFHNFGYTMLAMKFGDSHFFVRFAYHFERFWSRRSDLNLSVTNAMRQWLKSTWDVTATVLYDKPAPVFEVFNNAEDKINLWKDLKRDGHLEKLPQEWYTSLLKMSQDRPVVFVSSTSWSPDEDFGLLADALPAVDAAAEIARANTFVIITGRGAGRDPFMSRVAQMNLQRVKVLTAWLKIDDYPRLLASADVGLSFHKSSSGLDLPMKVVDMFGAGLPVIAVNFEALPELVKNEVNGIVFDNVDGLSKAMISAVQAHADRDESILRKCKLGVLEWREEGWDKQWGSSVKDRFLELLS
jgi:beta-1,4-mannosyltransferase